VTDAPGRPSGDRSRPGRGPVAGARRVSTPRGWLRATSNRGCSTPHRWLQPAAPSVLW